MVSPLSVVTNCVEYRRHVNHQSVTASTTVAMYEQRGGALPAPAGLVARWEVGTSGMLIYQRSLRSSGTSASRGECGWVGPKTAGGVGVPL